jgi:hypothetical protein
LDSLGRTWSHLDSLGLTRPHLVSHGLAWLHLVSLGLAWSHLVSLGLTWIQLVSLGLTWTHLVSLGLAWSHLDSLGLTGSHLVSLLDSLEAMCFAGVLRTSVTNGTGGTVSPKEKDRWQKIESNHTQAASEHIRTCTGGTREAPRSHRSTFQISRSTLICNNPKGHAPSPSPRRTILTPDPSLRITRAGTIKISRSDSPPSLRCFPMGRRMHDHTCTVNPGRVYTCLLPRTYLHPGVDLRVP